MMRKQTEKRIPVKAPPCTWLHGRFPIWHELTGKDGFFAPVYLKLFYSGGDMGDDNLMTRVYPPDRKGFKCVDVVMEDYGGWYWVYEREKKDDA